MSGYAASNVGMIRSVYNGLEKCKGEIASYRHMPEATEENYENLSHASLSMALSQTDNFEIFRR
jgi:hypothetical protein